MTPTSGASLADVRAQRQCAWCLLIVDESGRYSIPSTRTVRSATHGICPRCKEAVRAEFGGRGSVLARLART